MRVYLDTSVYNRPFDDQRQPRTWLETLAFTVILQLIESMTIELIVSETVQYENSRNPYPLRRQWVERCLAMASSKQSLDENIFHRALEFERNGIHAVDALHLA